MRPGGSGASLPLQVSVGKWPPHPTLPLLWSLDFLFCKVEELDQVISKALRLTFQL